MILSVTIPKVVSVYVDSGSSGVPTLETRVFSVLVKDIGAAIHTLSTMPTCDVHNVLTTFFFGAQSLFLSVPLRRGKEMAWNGVDLKSFSQIIAA